MSYEVLGYHLANNAAGMKVIERYHSLIDKILPGWVEILADGSLEIKESGCSNDKVNSYFTKNSIIPLVQNYQLDSAVSNQLLSNKKAQKNTIDNLLLYLQVYGFHALNLDLEGVKKENEGKFTEFVQNMSDIFHHNKCQLYLCIPAKSENNYDSSWSGAYNYHSLGNIIDKIIVMTYDYHWPGGPPGAIAPLDWVKDVMDFAILNIPLNKIIMGIGFYGYDWIIDSDHPARGVTYQQITNILSRYNTQIDWDQESQAPYLKYEKEGLEHEVWFENMESIKQKIKLVKEYNLAGVAFWRLGQEDEKLWNLIAGVK